MKPCIIPANSRVFFINLSCVSLEPLRAGYEVEVPRILDFGNGWHIAAYPAQSVHIDAYLPNEIVIFVHVCLLFSEGQMAIVNLFRAIQYGQPKIAKKNLTNRYCKEYISVF